ncbi:MAG TPA: hypothetical protein ENK66_04960 [Arcobacter sp.]|nr:hypothetical protein [Arcobacter sp.]
MKILTKTLPLILLLLIIKGCTLSKPIPKEYQNIRIENGELLGYAKMLNGTKFIGITQNSKNENNIELIKITKNGFYPNYLIKNYNCDEYNINICNSAFMKNSSNLGLGLGLLTIGVLAQGVKVEGGTNEENEGIENIIKVLGGLIGLSGATGMFRESKTFNTIKFLETIKNNRLENERQKLLNLSSSKIVPVKPYTFNNQNSSKTTINIPFNLKILNIPSPTSDEYVNLTLEISHKNTIVLDKSIIYLDGTQINPEQIRADERRNNKTYKYYRLGIPKGKNKIQAYVTTKNSGNSNTDSINVESTLNVVPTLHIVSVGVNTFPEWEKYDPGIHLKNSKNNTQAVNKVFHEKSTFLFDGKLNLISYATKKEDIKKTVQEIRESVRPNDYFVMYVATHGNIDNKDKYYFTPSDFFKRYGSMKNKFEQDDLSDYLINIPTIFRLVILDTCHSEQQILGVKEELKNAEIGKKQGVTVLVASQSKEQANTDYNGKGNGLFTQVLVDGLEKNADYNKDAIVTSLEIAKYLEKEVFLRSRTAKVQHTAVTYTNKEFALTLLDENKKPSVLKPKIYTSNVELNTYLRKIDNSPHKTGASFIQGKVTVQKVVNKILTTGSLDTYINFATGKATLDSDALKKVSLIAQALQEQQLRNKKILIGGHTDNQGSSNIQQRQRDNLTLSKRRADNVIDALVTRFGIERSRLTAKGYGETLPLESNNIKEGREANRRVNFSIF